MFFLDKFCNSLKTSRDEKLCLFGPVIKDIEQLRKQLNALYLSGETIMSLRNRNVEGLHSLSEKIESKYEEVLIKAQKLHVQKDNDIISSAVKNKAEFDAHKFDFLAKRADTQVDPCTSKGPPSVGNISLPSRDSNRSKVSSSSTAKLSETEAEFRAAQIRAEQAKERAEEEMIQQEIELQFQQELHLQKIKRSKREAQRELEIVASVLQSCKCGNNLTTNKIPSSAALKLVERSCPAASNMDSLSLISNNPSIENFE